MTGQSLAKRPAAAVASLALCLAGVLLSGYLTYEHFTDSTTLACSGSGAINCLKVTTSAWSSIAGVPVAVAGLAFFLVMTLLCAPLRFNEGTGLLRVAGVALGTVMVLWLIFVEIFELAAICLWCTGVHLVTVLLLGTVLWWRETGRTVISPG